MREKNNMTVASNNYQRRSLSKEKVKEKKFNSEKYIKITNMKKGKSESFDTYPNSKVMVSASKAGTDASEICEDPLIDYVDDYRSEMEITDEKLLDTVVEKNGNERNYHLKVMEKNGEGRNDPLSNHNKEAEQGSAEESDCETFGDSVSSQGDAEINKDVAGERASRVLKSLPRKQFDNLSHVAKTNSFRKEESGLRFKTPHSNPKKSPKTNRVSANSHDNQLSSMKVHPKPLSESSEGSYENSIEDVKEMDILNGASDLPQIIRNEDEAVHAIDPNMDEDKVNVEQMIQEMEEKVEKLEEELREIAALEISLYSVVAEHGRSANEVHTPARRLSRLYIHACKHWTQNRRASIARTIASGLALVAKSCGTDVPRLTFWWTNAIMLRKIISQAFGNSHQSTRFGKLYESDGVKRGETKWSSIKGKASLVSKNVNKIGFFQFADDWLETGTFTAALEKIESWIFSRIIESVWWQSLTPQMHSPVKNLSKEKSPGKLLGSSMRDQQQGNFSVNLWQNAFSDVFRRLCPARAGGHKCGCLLLLAKMVMEQCTMRLDVAMFNAIMRQSANEGPTDPVSDPFVNSKVLPIPAGYLSFGSGAQLKNSVGNWCRWLTDLTAVNADDLMKKQINHEDDERRGGFADFRNFPLLNTLSDLLMLPKDMLIDRSIREEVCPTFGLPLIKRILCNFTPDEFCPDPVPGSLLEDLHIESFVEQRKSGEKLISSLPCTAAAIVYNPPWVGNPGGGRWAADVENTLSEVQSRGYSSDDDLNELECPFTSIIGKSETKENGRRTERMQYHGETMRFSLLNEVWSA